MGRYQYTPFPANGFCHFHHFLMARAAAENGPGLDSSGESRSAVSRGNGQKW
jgi:hypothetical protein